MSNERMRQAATQRLQQEKKALEHMSNYVHKNEIESNQIRQEIMRAVTNVFRVLPEDIIGPSRVREVSNPRHAYCCLCSAIDPSSTLQQIGESISRNHSTVINSITKCNDLRETDLDFANDFNECVQQLEMSTNKDMQRIKFNTEHILRRNTQRQREMQQALTAISIVQDFMAAWDKEMEGVIGAKPSEKLTPRARGIIAAFSDVRKKATMNGF